MSPSRGDPLKQDTNNCKFTCLLYPALFSLGPSLRAQLYLRVEICTACILPQLHHHRRHHHHRFLLLWVSLRRISNRHVPFWVDALLPLDPHRLRVTFLSRGRSQSHIPSFTSHLNSPHTSRRDVFSWFLALSDQRKIVLARNASPRSSNFNNHISHHYTSSSLNQTSANANIYTSQTPNTPPHT